MMVSGGKRVELGILAKEGDNMGKCPECDLPLFGYINSDEKTEGKLCLRCRRRFDIKPYHPSKSDAGYESLILARQESDYD